ncbi:MAG: DMT family transporter [Phyllobacteriaceae bacterium]|nr:DMT family transporter [Nitratireductor sp.]MCO5134482.1 DMT family transporter [Phyllobacteriaceae bacterium]
MQSSGHIRENLQGALFMVVAMAGFAVNDAIVKSLGNTLNLGQVLMLRGLFATVMIYFLARLFGQWRSPRFLVMPRVLQRVSGELIATASFITALFNMPLGNTTAILQALPLALTAAAAVFFSEPVGWRRLAAILIGFAGVMIVIRPGLEGFNIYSVLVLVAVGGCVIRDLTTRILPMEIPGLMITFSTSLAVTLMGAAIIPFQGWNPIGAIEWAKIAATSIFLIVGYYFVISAMRVGDIGFVSPFRYAVLIFAMIGGFFAFGERPDLLTLAGSAIIVATGVYTLYRERVVHRQSITPPPNRS